MTKLKRNRIIIFTAATAVIAILAFFFGFGGRGVAYADGAEPVPTASEKTENGLTDGTGGEYTLPTEWVYGDKALETAAPKLEFGNEFTSEYTHVSLAVDVAVMNGVETETDNDTENVYEQSFETVYIVNDFPIDEIPYYVNGYMPVGEYTLIVEVDEITVTEGPDVGVYAAFKREFGFSVTEAEISDSIKKDLAEKLDGNLFTYVYDGGAHFIPDDFDCAAFVGGDVIYDRGTDNYWATSAADEYFDSGFALTFNLSRMMNNHYHTAEYLVSDEVDCNVAAPVHADKYTVFYQLEAKNFKPLADIESESRKQSMFYVVVVKEVTVPVFTAVYNGELQTAPVDDEYMPYTVIENDGGTAADTYGVTLRLRDPELYMWKGQTLSERDADIETTFEITKANNGWTVMPDIVRWTEGDYDPAENTVVGSARFGKVNIIITDADDNVVYDKLSGVDKLGSARAGVYTLTAYVAGTENYEGIEGEYVYSKTFKVYGKGGMVWWGILLIVIAVIAVIALGLYLLDLFDIVHFWGRKKVAEVRAQASVDATIAAVRATQSAREQDAEKSKALSKERAAERKAEREAEKSASVSAQAVALEKKAREAEEKAEQYRAKAQKMTEVADAAKRQAAALAAGDIETVEELETAADDVSDDNIDNGTEE